MSSCYPGLDVTPAPETNGSSVGAAAHSPNAPAKPKQRLQVAGDLRETLQDTRNDLVNLVMQRRGEREPHKFYWFKYACCGSWLTISLSFIMFIVALVCLNELNGIQRELCAEPEFNTTLSDCRGKLYSYAHCIETKNPLTSRDLRRCFLRQPDAIYIRAVEQSYALAHRYENASISYGLARNLMLQEERLESAIGRRLQRVVPGAIQTIRARRTDMLAVGSSSRRALQVELCPSLQLVQSHLSNQLFHHQSCHPIQSHRRTVNA